MLSRCIKTLSACSVFFSINNFNQKSLLKMNYFWPTVFIYMSISICIYIYISLYLYLSLYLSMFVSIYIYISIAIYLYIYLYLFVIISNEYAIILKCSILQSRAIYNCIRQTIKHFRFNVTLCFMSYWPYWQSFRHDIYLFK